MPRKSAIDPALRALLDQAKAAKRQQRADLKPLRDARRDLRKRVHNIAKSVERRRARLTAYEADVAGTKPEWRGLLFSLYSIHLAEMQKTLAASEADLAVRQNTLDTFDLLHPELTNG